MIVRLNKKQFDYLENSLFEKYKVLELKRQQNKNLFLIQLDDNVVDEIRD
jgi:hypothetical protein